MTRQFVEELTASSTEVRHSHRCDCRFWLGEYALDRWKSARSEAEEKQPLQPSPPPYDRPKYSAENVNGKYQNSLDFTHIFL